MSGVACSKSNRHRICDSCTGCSACAMVCPTQAIGVSANKEGFYQADIDDSKCIKCGACEKVCPERTNYSDKKQIHQQKFYACRNLDLKIVRESSSGGVFSAIAKDIIEMGGSVYGVIIEYPSCEITYTRATSLSEISAMRGSKYVQAHLSRLTLEMFMEDVEKDNPVLFVGTSCYVAGIKKILEFKHIKYNNVVFVDFICAGVISTKLWNAEVEHFSREIGEISKAGFRDKKRGWRDFSVVFENSAHKREQRFTLSAIGLLQSIDEALGVACNNCRYRSYEKPGDITIGDFWNEQYLPSRWWDDKGVSTVMVNTKCGEEMLHACDKDLEIIPVEKHMVFNSRFSGDYKEIEWKKRDDMYNDVENMEYSSFKKKWIRVTFKDYILLGIIRPIFLKLGLHRLKKNER